LLTILTEQKEVPWINPLYITLTLLMPPSPAYFPVFPQSDLFLLFRHMLLVIISVTDLLALYVGQEGHSHKHSHQHHPWDFCPRLQYHSVQ